ncbi:hypothetical protein LCGC14_0434460 [marine sediment metagenome]|uniref:Uncharacterized protein n=1 Tax=marine sediment metagenome TaxID=412755 RepID=A0A0F9V968_9ZZZZ
MPDLIVYIPDHGYSNTDFLYISWLDANHYVSDKTANSFKLTTTSGGATYIQFSESIISGSVREETESAVTTITGLDHLEGEQVYVLSNGVSLGLHTVSGGSVTVLSEVFSYSVGLAYESTLQPMKLDISGLGLATTKKVAKVIASLNKTVGGQIGTDAQHLDNIKYRDAGGTGDEFPYFTGDVEQTLPGGYGRSGDVMVKQTDPQPMTVLSFTFDLGVRND